MMELTLEELRAAAALREQQHRRALAFLEAARQQRNMPLTDKGVFRPSTQPSIFGAGQNEEREFAAQGAGGAVRRTASDGGVAVSPGEHSNASSSRKIANIVTPQASNGNSAVRVRNGQPRYFKTIGLARQAMIDQLVAATRRTGDEHSSILFFDRNQAGQGLFAYSYTAIRRGHPDRVEISGSMPNGARAREHYHTHNVPSVPSGPADVGPDKGLAGSSITAYVVGLDGARRIIRTTGYF